MDHFGRVVCAAGKYLNGHHGSSIQEIPWLLAESGFSNHSTAIVCSIAVASPVDCNLLHMEFKGTVLRDFYFDFLHQAASSGPISNLINFAELFIF